MTNVDITLARRNFGKLEPVEPRKCWPDEARDLTPWVASVDGLQLLGQAVGMDLACESCEVAVGPFSGPLHLRRSKLAMCPLASADQ